MREWLRLAACLNHPDIMFDPALTEYALSLCKLCPALDPCRQDASGWMDQMNVGVVAGINRHLTKYGRPRPNRIVIERKCLGCEMVMLVDTGSTKRWCTQRCYEAGDAESRLAKRDVAVMGDVLDQLIGEATG